MTLCITLDRRQILRERETWTLKIIQEIYYCFQTKCSLNNATEINLDIVAENIIADTHTPQKPVKEKTVQN